MSRTHTADGRRRSSMTHARRKHTCDLCGKVTHGNGGHTSHMCKHIREAGLDHMDYPYVLKAYLVARDILWGRGTYKKKDPK